MTMVWFLKKEFSSIFIILVDSTVVAQRSLKRKIFISVLKCLWNVVAYFQKTAETASCISFINGSLFIDSI